MDNNLVLGQWNAICDVCGEKYKSGQLKARWDGLMVCEKDWELRHIADFIKAPPPLRALPWTRPRPTDIFVDVTYGSQGTQDNTIPPGTNDNEM